MSTLASSHLSHTLAHHQRGLVVVELAIVVPFLILTMFATAELGRALFQYTTLTKAVEAGARYYASDQGISEDTIKNLVVFASTDAGNAVLHEFSTANVTVDNAPINHVTVSASYSFVPMLGAKLPFYGKFATFTMTATQVMRTL